MGKGKRKKELTGPWGKIYGAIWLIGLAVLAIKGWWWPGILVLVAISIIAQAILQKTVPEAFEELETGDGSSTVIKETPAIADAEEDEGDVLERLPAICPKCGGPLRGHDIRRTGKYSVECPFCGINLPLSEPGKTGKL